MVQSQWPPAWRRRNLGDQGLGVHALHAVSLRLNHEAARLFINTDEAEAKADFLDLADSAEGIFQAIVVPSPFNPDPNARFLAVSHQKCRALERPLGDRLVSQSRWLSLQISVGSNYQHAGYCLNVATTDVLSVGSYMRPILGTG